VFSGRGAEFCESNAREEAKLRALQASLRNRQRIAQLAITLLFGALACATMAWTATHFGSGSEAGGNWVIAFTLAVFPLVESCVGLPEAAQSADNLLDSLDRLRDAGAAEPEVGENPSEVVRCIETNSMYVADECQSKPVETMNPPRPCLAFESVSFAYAGGARGVLNGITLEIPSGQKVAILGRSGAGKSTLLTLARGELRSTQGAIFVDGIPIDQIADVSQHIAVVEQDAYLFNQTLRQNVVLARDAIDDEDVREALAAVGLGPLLDSLPQGLDTLMGEMGARFSGGERQRIALARVLLSPSPLVLFDEPSVGLDPANEHALFDSIFATLADRTLVVVTHHLLEAGRFDRIVFIEDGCIVLDGAPSDLERDSARYRQLLAFDQGRDVW